MNFRNSNNEDIKSCYKRYFQIISKVLQQLRTYNNLILQADIKQKVSWNIINTLTNQKTSNDNDPTYVNGQSSTSIENAFNNYFISVAENL